MKVKVFDPSINIEQALLWQHNKAVRLQSLIASKQAWYDEKVSGAFAYWFAGIFDLSTCGEDGLRVWSIILGIPLFVTSEPSPVGYPAFGFASFGFNFYGDPSDPTPAGSNFAIGAGGAVSGLSVEDARKLLQVRYFQLTTNGSVTEINRMLSYVFGDGAGYVVDNLDMTMTVVFNEFPSAALLNALSVLDVIPRPAGVELNITLGYAYSFGFADYGRNFLPPSNFARF